jgi:hypothetical protein
MTDWTENNPASSDTPVEANKNRAVARVEGDGYSYPVEGDLLYADIDFTHWDRNEDSGDAPTEAAAPTPSTWTETEEGTTTWTES